LPLLLLLRRGSSCASRPAAVEAWPALALAGGGLDERPDELFALPLHVRGGAQH
jgi:hypothetical protein